MIKSRQIKGLYNREIIKMPVTTIPLHGAAVIPAERSWPSEFVAILLGMYLFTFDSNQKQVSPKTHLSNTKVKSELNSNLEAVLVQRNMLYSSVLSIF